MDRRFHHEDNNALKDEENADYAHTLFERHDLDTELAFCQNYHNFLFNFDFST